jgi:hypothetical protein
MANNRVVFWGVCIRCPHYAPYFFTHDCYYREGNNCNFEWEDNGFEKITKETEDVFEKHIQAQKIKGDSEC